MIYLIDHEDSFTFNLAHLLGYFDNVFITNYFDINKIKLQQARTIVLSPGPGHPLDYPQTQEVYLQYKEKKKIIGICLGFQQILCAEGGNIIQQKKIYHGYQSVIEVLKTSQIFKSSRTIYGGRYHSLKLQEPFKSATINITMRCKKTNVAMALEDQKNHVYGFQFHPESFLTNNGKYLIQKILSA